MPQINDPTTTLTYLEKGDRIAGASPSQFSNILAENVFQRALTYAQLEALVTASTLIPAMWYKITNATSANFNLLVQAVDVNKIGCDAKDPLYPNDVVKYNFASNVITWRWDTVQNVSAYEDWRNSNALQIGTNPENIHIGKNGSGTIGDNCNSLVIGNNCTNFVFPDDSTSFKLFDNVVDCIITTNCPNYDQGGVGKEIRGTQAGVLRMNYYNASNVFTSVDPTA